jgi:hypothetical protein
MHHQNRRQLLFLGLGGLDQVAPQLAVTRRRNLHVLGLDALVLGLDLLGGGELGIQGFEQRGSAHARDRQCAGAVDEVTPRNRAMHVLVEQLKDFGREFFGF